MPDITPEVERLVLLYEIGEKRRVDCDEAIIALTGHDSAIRCLLDSLIKGTEQRILMQDKLLKMGFSKKDIENMQNKLNKRE